MVGETIMSLLIFVGSIFMYYKATQLRQMEAYQDVGPDFWPKLILIGLILISGYLSVSNITKQLKWKESANVSQKNDEGWLRISITVFIIIGYIFLLKPMGFISASPLFIIAMMVLIRPDQKKTIPAGVVGIMAIIYILFGRLLLIPLPKGQGFFRSISIYLGL